MWTETTEKVFIIFSQKLAKTLSALSPREKKLYFGKSKAHKGAT